MTWIRMAKVGDLEVGGKGCTTSVNNEEIALFRTAEGFRAVQNSCPHRGAPLAGGHLEGQELMCPWHGWSFNVRSGECITSPEQPIRTYPVRVDGDDVYVEV